MTAENYSAAWDTLTAFYENKRRLINDSVGQLFTIKSMKAGSYAELSKRFSATFEAVSF